MWPLSDVQFSRFAEMEAAKLLMSRHRPDHLGIIVP
jgi:hypothetical protein